MSALSHLSELPGFQTTSITIDTTNLTLARFSKLPKDSLAKILTIFEASLEGALQARLFANTIATYALGATFFFGFMAAKSPRESVQKVATVLTAAAALTTVLAGFTSLVYTFQIHDFLYWKNVCVTFMNPPIG